VPSRYLDTDEGLRSACVSYPQAIALVANQSSRHIAYNLPQKEKTPALRPLLALES